MEGKKKKNKKKKGNQAKQNESTSTTQDVNQTKQSDSVSNVVVIQDHDYATSCGMDQRTEVPSNAISQIFGVSDSEAEQEGHKNLEANSEELQEEANRLEVEKDMSSQKEGTLEEQIKYLQEEVSSCIQREVSLEYRIGVLQSKHASLTLREDDLEQRVERVEDLNQSLTLEKVMELKESRDNLEKENKHLTERISTLESRILHLEMVASSYDFSKVHREKDRHQEEAKVSGEPDVLYEESAAKVSEIHVEPDNGEDIVKAASDDFSKSREIILESNGKIQTMGCALENFSTNGGDDFVSTGQSEQIRLLRFDDSGISEDVVSVPLDDSVHGLKSIDEMDSEQTVPISDAPLIGAPFRLISLVTRYVSGADLVDQPKSHR